MLLSKLKIKSSRLKTIDASVCFHLDEEQEEMALQAKKQLEACSQEVFEEFPQREIISCQKARDRGVDLRESTLTRETENETKSVRSRTQKQTIKSKSSCKCQGYSKRHPLEQKTNSPKKQAYELMSSIKLEGHFENDKLQKQRLILNRYAHRMEVQTQRKVQRSGLFGVTFRSYSTHLEGKDSPRKYTLFSSRKNRSSKNFDYSLDTESSRPYSFNETMNGVDKYRNVFRSNQRQVKLFREQNVRPTTCRGPGVNLRPQFLRLITRIKEKQEVECKKKILIVKGRRSRI